MFSKFVSWLKLTVVEIRGNYADDGTDPYWDIEPHPAYKDQDGNR